MKNIINYLILVSILLFFSCSEAEMPLYEGTNNIQFKKGEGKYTKMAHTFVFLPGNITRDTVDITVELMGELSDQDREFNLVQIEDFAWEPVKNEFGVVIDSVRKTLLQAEPGKHYEPLDKTLFRIPAHENKTVIPLIFIRDPGLVTDRYYLRLRIELVDPGLQLGDLDMVETVHFISDQLEKPARWDETNFLLRFGEYSRRKHRFMIDVSGMIWDDKLVNEVLSSSSMAGYYNDKFKKALDEVGPIYDENGKQISFPK